MVMTFAEDIPLTAGSIRFESVGNAPVSCNLSYLKKQVPATEGSLKMVEADDKRRVLCIPAGPLPVGISGNLVFSKSLSRGLSDDYKRGMTIAKEFSVKEFVANSPSQGCLYTTTPTSYGLREVTVGNGGKFIGSNGDLYSNSCPDKDGLYDSWMDVRFTPNSTSTLSIGAGARDALGQLITQSFTQSDIKVGSAGDNDQYLYTSIDKNVVTIPSDVPLVVSLQGINIDRAKIQVCELDSEGYLAYRNAEDNYTSNYTPKCLSEVTRDITIKNRNWNLSQAQFDVSEFLGRPMASNFILVRGSVANQFNTNNGYIDRNQEFRTVYLRQNLSLALISGDNSKLFASSLDGKSLSSDLTFEALGNGGGSFAAKWNATTKLYDIDPVSTIPTILIAKNAQYF
jgi:hypothetical protein